MAKAKNFKKDKFEERLLHEMNSMLRREVGDPRAMFMSFTKVELSPDYSFANVYWDTFDAAKKADCQNAINGFAGLFRSHLAKTLKVRHTPEIRFSYDNSYEAALAITNLLKSEDDDQE